MGTQFTRRTILCAAAALAACSALTGGANSALLYRHARVEECARVDLEDLAITARTGTIRLHGKGDEVREGPLGDMPGGKRQAKAISSPGGSPTTPFHSFAAFRASHQSAFRAGV